MATFTIDDKVLYSFASGTNDQGLKITNVGGKLMAEEADLIKYFKFFRCADDLNSVDKVLQLSAAWAQSMPEDRISIIRLRNVNEASYKIF